MFITFIIPTIGRITLINSINSLLNLKDNDWNAIIIFDGIKNNIDIKDLDNRIKIIEIEKSGIEDIKNNAGIVRNIAFDIILESDNKPDWIGFLDDDDYLSSDYICCLKDEIKINPIIDVCIFRMAYENGCIIPQKNDRNIIRNKVGISFCLKYDLIKDNKFINSPFEDYIFLKNLQHKKYKILISSYVCYFIRILPFKCDFYPKIII